MSENAIRDELNRMKWHTGDLDQARFKYTHRLVSSDGKTLDGFKIALGTDIVSIGPSSVEILVDVQDVPFDSESVIVSAPIPYHRIMALWRGDKLVWDRPTKENE